MSQLASQSHAFSDGEGEGLDEMPIIRDLCSWNVVCVTVNLLAVISVHNPKSFRNAIDFGPIPPMYNIIHV